MFDADNDEEEVVNESEEEKRSNDDGDSSYEEEEGSDTEEEAMEVDEDEVNLAKRASLDQRRGRPKSKLLGKSGFVWTTSAPKRRSDRQSDQRIPQREPQLAGPAENVETIEEFWDLIITGEMIDIIVENTNEKIENVCAILEAEEKIKYYHHLTSVSEIRAYIGVLYYAGLWKSSKVDDNRLWSKDNGVTLYRCVFSRHRFSFLSSCLRFDVREERDPNDRFAPFRRIWDIFIHNCQTNFSPGEKCTVDEQLLSFRGRCKFRVYMKDKPDKYGLEIIRLNDSETSYMYNAIPYLGKNSAIVAPREELVPEFYFRNVTTPIHGSNRTVTCDNWYTSIPLLQRMLKDPYNITITGTIKKNKREIPAELKKAAKDPPSTTFCHTLDLTLLSYTPKKTKSNKVVLVVSSYMHTSAITDNKPDIVRHYNKTKGGTDNYDKLCHSYSVTRRTNRWPMRYFFGIIDQAAVQTRVLKMLQLRNENSREKISAMDVLDKLYFYLIKPMLQERYASLAIPRDVKAGIACILKSDLPMYRDLEKVKLDHRQRCCVCPRNKDKKTFDGCSKCAKPICPDHSLLFCPTCVNGDS